MQSPVCLCSDELQGIANSLLCSIPTHAEGPGSDVEIAMIDYVPATDEVACARQQISELERASEAMPDKPASQFAA